MGEKTLAELVFASKFIVSANRFFGRYLLLGCCLQFKTVCADLGILILETLVTQGAQSPIRCDQGSFSSFEMTKLEIMRLIPCDQMYTC